jgi:NADPH:quinone reductase-like Zn-dependent oxidoreductase
VIGFGFAEHGGPERLGPVSLPEPRPGPGELRVRLRASAFNRLDRFVLEGIPGVPVERPHVLGSDGAGRVDEVGAGVEGFRAGEAVLLNPGLWDADCEACRRGEEALCRNLRIVGEHTQGTMTELLVLPARNVHPKPSTLSFPEAAALPLAYQTAWRALRTVGALQRGERVAIIGAGGAVAPAALQVALGAGAEVSVYSRSADKLERAGRLGATHAVAVDPGQPIDRQLWSESGKRGYDLIFDSVGASSVPRTLKGLARGGRLVVIGATTGPLAEIDLRTLFWRQASIRGSTMAGRAEFEAMLASASRGELRPVVDSTFEFAQARAAYDRFAGGEAFGKVVVTRPE